MKQLFTLSASVDNFEGCDQVPFCFFIRKRKGFLAPYEQLIKGYNPKDEHIEYAKEFVDEMFTLEEATQAYEYLKRKYGTEATIKAYDLPIEAMNMMPTGAIPVGGLTGMLRLEKSDNYDLPFYLGVYYDLRQAKERTEEPDLRHGRLTIETHNQAVVEFGYAVKELLDPWIESGGKLSFEQANSYYSCWYNIGKWLERLPDKYRQQHQGLIDFYLNKDLSNDWDRLQLLDNPNTTSPKGCGCQGCKTHEDDHPF